MAEKQLHIVSFDVPFPPDYGGAIDVYYKLKALSEAGVKVHLHVFEYGRSRAAELEQLCSSVHYYPRAIQRLPILGKLPYIVSSRTSPELLQRLLADEHPVLLEGVHSCGHLETLAAAGKRVVVRMHNIEHVYYRKLAEATGHPGHYLFFLREASRLEQFEPVLRKAAGIAAISPAEERVLQQKFNQVFYLPAFHAHRDITSEAGMGKGIVYHGNLKVAENEQAAIWLVKEVFSKVPDLACFVVGNGAGLRLRRMIARAGNVQLVEQLSAAEVSEWVHRAQVNVLPTFQATGIKLKLLQALFTGRHCVVNTPMIEENGLEALCQVADQSAAMALAIRELVHKPFTENDVQARKEMLSRLFDPEKNVRILMDRLWP